MRKVNILFKDGCKGTCASLQAAVMDLLEKYPSGVAIDTAGNKLLPDSKDEDIKVDKSGLAFWVWENGDDAVGMDPSKAMALVRIDK